MELQRDIYKELLAWKKEDSGHVLELRGARQVGKTFILDKFARENYNTYLYINMVQTSGREFLECLDAATAWVPGTPRKEHPLHDALSMFEEKFEDRKDTIVIIDEIQESAKVYSLIRQFAREFKCHFVVAGSYPGKTLSKEYFQPVGDLDIFTLYTLSFEEFLGAIDRRNMAEDIDPYGGGRPEEYDELKKYYGIYCQIGGYPSVVKKYIETGSGFEAEKELEKIIQIFIDESEHYFNSVIEMNMFEQLFPAIAQTMIKEKKGSSDLVTELSRIIYKDDSGRITKKGINTAIGWLYRSHIVGFCGQATECNPIEITMNRRFYFLDIGVCRYFLDMSGADSATTKGIITENFVYIDLLKRTLKRELAWATPVFGTYKNGEIDFLIKNRMMDAIYGIEVKGGSSEGKTARQLLKDNKVNAVYFLKGDTYGGIADRKITVPVYLIQQIKFSYNQAK